MFTKKSVIILAIIAIVLVGITIAINISDSEEISTTKPITGNSINNKNGGEIGIKILQPEVEDKLAGQQS